MATQPVAGIVLAAGKGARMNSDQPKALFQVCGVPMVELSVRALRGAGVEAPVVVIGPEGGLIQRALGDGCKFALQEEPLGTGHATLAAENFLRDHRGPVLIVPGDAPLITSTILRELLEAHRFANAAATLATIRLHDPTGYGRIVRDPHGKAQRVVEESEASPRIRSIQEVCTSVYCFESDVLLSMLPRLERMNAQQQYYLTDMVELIYNAGAHVETRMFEDQDSLRGVNDRWELAKAANNLRRRILRQLCLDGVSIVDPETTYVSIDAEIGRDTVIEPMTTVVGGSRIGMECRIGPMATINQSLIGNRCQVVMSQLNGATLKDGVRCGPYANLRPGSVIGEEARIGNFVEVKNSSIGKGATAAHLSYVGDASVGEDTNIGAGAITCNYDGFTKHKTQIGANAFIGSNSTLVAPVTIGDGAVIGAGSVITKDVPGDALGIARAIQEVKEEWAVKWRKRKQTPVL